MVFRICFAKFMVLSCSVFWAGAVASEEPLLLGLSTGSVGGAYFDVGLAICDEINKRRGDEEIYCFVQGSEGSDENLDRLKSGFSNLAIVQSDIYHAKILEAPGSVGSQIASLYSEPLHIFSPKGSGIETFDDVSGLRVDISSEGSGTHFAALRLIEGLGLKIEDASSIVELSAVEKIEAICREDVDISFWLSAEANAIAVSAMDECSPNLLSIGSDELNSIGLGFGLRPYTFSNDVYRGISNEIQTVSVNALLVAGPQVSKKDTFRIKKVIRQGTPTLLHNNRFLSGKNFKLIKD